MKIPFTKAHGAMNDFLLTWATDIQHDDLGRIATAICDRHAGIGADGWLVVAAGAGDVEGSIRLFNPDGSEPEISGNGTRCAAAFLLDAGMGNRELTIETGAGHKRLTLVERAGNRFVFEMNMGIPRVEQTHFSLRLRSGERDAVVLDVGNPQCAVIVDDFNFDWRSLGAEIERHPQFPNRTNVSFVLAADRHTVEVRFFERGVGETMSSGTGSTGAAMAASARNLVEWPVRILTPAGLLEARMEGREVFLTGPAELVGRGEFFFEG